MRLMFPLNPTRWRGHPDKLLPRPSRVKEVARHPATPYAEGVLHAEWREIDLPGGVWTVPVPQMKTRGKHRVPLSDSAMRVLDALPRIKDSPLVFP